MLYEYCLKSANNYTLAEIMYSTITVRFAIFWTQTPWETKVIIASSLKPQKLMNLFIHLILICTFKTILQMDKGLVIGSCQKIKLLEMSYKDINTNKSHKFSLMNLFLNKNCNLHFGQHLNNLSFFYSPIPSKLQLWILI